MVRIISDTTATIAPDVARRYAITVIPQIITFGMESYREGVDIDNPTFMLKLTSARDSPKTAAPPPELFAAEFRRLLPLGESILCIHPSADISGTVRSATVAASYFPDSDIRVIDTRSVASPLGSMVLLAAELGGAGLAVDAIEARLRLLIPRARIYFLVATLDYLARGGRIGGATALLGGILQVKPILTVKDGRVERCEQERTWRRAIARLVELVQEQSPRDDSSKLTVMHAGVPREGELLAQDLGRRLGMSQPPIVDVPPAIVTHGGPGMLGVGFFTAA
jgi:DegV family protein with EDD domain